MASSSPAIQKFSHHTRSISFPSQSHPLNVQVEQQLCRLRSSQLATSSSSTSICHNLASLQDLYESVDDLIQLPLTQRSLCSEKQVDRVMDGSLKLLDICGTTSETLSQMKQGVQDIQSSLRRRAAESDLASKVSVYMASSKKGKKAVQKCIGDVKKMDNSHSDDDNETVRILSEVQTITIAVFESLLSYISNSKATSKQSNWSFISRLKCKKEGKATSEMANVDTAIKGLICQKSGNKKDVQKQMEVAEMSIQGFEDGLDCLFRCLIKTRVSLLNSINKL